MKAKHFRAGLFFTAFIAILAESLLAPFYPQLFERVFHTTDPVNLGVYIGVCRLSLMLAFPYWAWLSKRIGVARILSFTQGLAGLISISCYLVTDLTVFFGLSLLMTFFKSSYLLIYTLLVENSDKKGREIGWLGFTIHAAMVVSSVLGAWLFQHYNPANLFVIIGLLDFLQMGICLFLFRGVTAPVKERSTQANIFHPDKESLIWISVLTFIFYGLTSMLRPFYTEFIINHASVNRDMTMAGLLFGIPAISVLLIYPFFQKSNLTENRQILFALLLLIPVSIALQLEDFSLPLTILIRLLYGVGIFYIFILLDTLFFTMIPAGSSALLYGFMHSAQNLAYITAPMGAALVVKQYGLQSPFWLATFLGILFIPALLYFMYQQKRSGKSAVALESNL